MNHHRFIKIVKLTKMLIKYQFAVRLKSSLSKHYTILKTMYLTYSLNYYTRAHGLVNLYMFSKLITNIQGKGNIKKTSFLKFSLFPE